MSILSPKAVIQIGDEFEFAPGVWGRSTRIGKLAGFKCRYRRPLVDTDIAKLCAEIITTAPELRHAARSLIALGKYRKERRSINV